MFSVQRSGTWSVRRDSCSPISRRPRRVVQVTNSLEVRVRQSTERVRTADARRWASQRGSGMTSQRAIEGTHASVRVGSAATESREARTPYACTLSSTEHRERWPVRGTACRVCPARDAYKCQLGRGTVSSSSTRSLTYRPPSTGCSHPAPSDTDPGFASIVAVIRSPTLSPSSPHDRHARLRPFPWPTR
ncbi:hypothetical protein OH76DRAFT_703078 [Lentinus brumalis]|uniref:Uncharacterized protein n=1 Tax=Lentinus brumalis TaxID=2498619 RepID=A0A371D5T8_9APHY|nr:hypothetical protein OH76DRAFT_703078 [Polyporus brumalis]